MNYRQVDYIMSFICKKRRVRYGGCVTANKICSLKLNTKTDIYYIVDVIPKHTAEIGHFTLLRTSPENIVYFDSYGNKLEFYNKKFKSFFKNAVKKNRTIVNLSVPLQSLDSLVCGLYSVMAADVLIKYGINNFKSYVKRVYGGGNTRLNDRRIMKVFYSLPQINTPPCKLTFCNNERCERVCANIIRKNKKG